MFQKYSQREEVKMENEVDKHTIPRYRTIKGCLREIKKLDNDTVITEYYIRRLCREQKITYHLSGNKSLVSLDSLLEYLGFT